PATSLDWHDHVPISRHIETLRQDDVQRHAKERWNGYLPKRLEQAQGWRAEFPLEIDLVGRSHGETSFVGIVHVDGNEVGQAIKSWLDRCLERNVGDEQVRAELRKWSQKIEELGNRVLRAVISRAAACV